MTTAPLAPPTVLEQKVYTISDVTPFSNVRFTLFQTSTPLSSLTLELKLEIGEKPVSIIEK